MNLFKRFWPFLVILLVWFIFSAPYFINHKVPFSSTYLVNFFSPWNAYPGFSSPVKNGAMPDVISQIYPWKNFTISTFKDFQIPLWNPYSFSGTPHLANYQSAVLSPFNLLFFILPFIDAWSLLVLLQPLLAGIFMYLFLRSLKLKKESSLVSSIAFMFCGFITTWMAYATLGYAILFLPLSLFAIEKFYESKKIYFLFLFSLTFPLSFFSGHFQISIYFLLFIFLYILFKYYQTRNLRNLVYLVIYSIIGILLSLPQLLPSMELYTQSLRSGIFEKLEVIPWGYLPTFVAPDFLGNPVTRNDWFGHYAEWNAYIGLIPIFLGLYSLTRRTKVILFFFMLSLLSLLLSFQTPFLDILIQLRVPVLSTSAASRIIVLFSFSMAALSAFGLENLLEDLKDKRIKKILAFGGLTLLIFAVLWVVVLLKLLIPLDKIIIARQNLILPTIILLSFLAVLFLGILSSRIKKSFILKIIPYVLIVIVAFDLFRFSSKWMPFDPKSLVFPQIPVADEFKRISGYERVMTNMGGEATNYYKLPSLDGYDAVYIKRYGEFVASLDTGDLSESARSVVNFPKNGLDSKKAVNLLGVKYIVHKVSDGRSPWAFPFWTLKQDSISTLYDDGKFLVLENKNAYPRAFLVGKYTVENNDQRILNTMFSNDFDLRNNVVLEENPNLVLDESEGNVKIDSYSADKITMETTSNGASLLFLSDSYYPGWKALVDGKEEKIYRADYAFRAIFIPKGEHKVQFVFEPLSFEIGLLGFAAGVLAILASFVVYKRGKLS